MHTLLFLDLGDRKGYPFGIKLFVELPEAEWSSIERLLLPSNKETIKVYIEAHDRRARISLADVRFCVSERTDLYGYRRNRAFIVDELRQSLVGMGVFVFSHCEIQ